jgi:hypothetical protein
VYHVPWYGDAPVRMDPTCALRIFVGKYPPMQLCCAARSKSRHRVTALSTEVDVEHWWTDNAEKASPKQCLDRKTEGHTIHICDRTLAIAANNVSDVGIDRDTEASDEDCLGIDDNLRDGRTDPDRMTFLMESQ